MLEPQADRGCRQSPQAIKGGLLDVTSIHAFRKTASSIYRPSPRGAGGTGTMVVRGRLAGDRLENVQVISACSLNGGGQTSDRGWFSTAKAFSKSTR